MNQLLEMFPNISRSLLETSLDLHGTVSRAALALSHDNAADDLDLSDDDLDKPSFMMPSKDKDENVTPSLSSILENLKRNMDGEKEKIKVDEEDILNDAMAYYKHPDFDPKKPLRVIFNNQPAADIGGVSRQFYTQLLSLLSEEFFQGDTYKLPTYNSQVVASGVMKLIGTITVQSILQGGPSLKVFSPAIYHYLASGDSDGAIQKMSVNDCSMRIKEFITKVKNTISIFYLHCNYYLQ